MKLLIQIPCLNEETTLPLVLNDIPKVIPGISTIDVLVIDDGSTDNTVQVAKQYNVDHIIQNISNKGLGKSFALGMDFATENNYDILVNTDGDNQYPLKYINELIQPILDRTADIVVGNRQTSQVTHFSVFKKFFQWLGTKVTILLSGNKNIADAVSGFRAYSRNAMLELNVTSSFSYVLDNTIQASSKKLTVQSIPIEINAPTRPSRLFANNFQHIRKSGISLIRTFALYKPLRLFIGLAIVLFIIGMIPIVRFMFDYIFADGRGKIQSLIIGCTILSVSMNFFALGMIGDLLSKNRALTEKILKHLKK